MFSDQPGESSNDHIDLMGGNDGFPSAQQSNAPEPVRASAPESADSLLGLEDLLLGPSEPKAEVGRSSDPFSGGQTAAAPMPQDQTMEMFK